MYILIFHFQYIFILSLTCTLARVCISKFACPSFQIADDGSIFVHEDLCIGDGSCIPVCPSGALELEKFEVGGDTK
ncbi:4Fe-4S binding protein [Fervidobacterium gondwanense]|uniref:4Fe-4S binding protein n=1 Tax=Fervidobacterium gondwanense TaxID=44754 RepID=UPI003DA097A4